MPDNPELLKRITARPDVFGGKPIIRDMRISVELVLSLSEPRSQRTDELLDDYSWIGTGRHPSLRRLRLTPSSPETYSARF